MKYKKKVALLFIGLTMVCPCQQTISDTCFTELISIFLDHIMTAFVKKFSLYINDADHALQPLQTVKFSANHKFIFAIDVIPLSWWLRALK